jgi:RNA-directed DNA polymerase
VELIQQINPVVRGWGKHFKRAHVRGLFHQLDGWIVRRIWSHRYRRWRCAGWRELPRKKLYGQLGLVNLIDLIPSLSHRQYASSRKLLAGNLHEQFGRRAEASPSMGASPEPTIVRV